MDWNSLVGDKATAGSIRNWANDSRPDAPTILDEAQAWIARRLRARQMLGTATGTATESAASVALPDDYLEAKAMRWTGTNAGPLDKIRPETIEARYSYDGDGNRNIGQPRYYAAIGTEAVFDVAADQAYTWRLLYYGTPTPLGTGTGSSTSNFLTQRYPTLVRYACMAGVAGFNKNDTDRAYWEQKAAAEIAQINLEQEREMAASNVDMTPEVI